MPLRLGFWSFFRKRPFGFGVLMESVVSHVVDVMQRAVHEYATDYLFGILCIRRRPFAKPKTPLQIVPDGQPVRAAKRRLVGFHELAVFRLSFLLGVEFHALRRLACSAYDFLRDLRLSLRPKVLHGARRQFAGLRRLRCLLSRLLIGGNLRRLAVSPQ